MGSPAGPNRMKSKVLPTLCAWVLLCAGAANAREHPDEGVVPPSDGSMADWVDSEPVALTPRAAQLVAAAPEAAIPALKPTARIAAAAAPVEEQPVADDMSVLDDEEQALQMQLKQMAPDVAKGAQPAARPAAKLAPPQASRSAARPSPPQVPSSLVSAPPQATRLLARQKKPLDEDELEDMRLKNMSPEDIAKYRVAKANKLAASTKPIKGSVMPKPLKMVPKASGATVTGKLPPGLGEGWLSVEMQGRMLLVQYEVGGDDNTAAVEQRIVLGFDPQGQAKVEYSKSTGAFKLEVPGPKAPSHKLHHVPIKRK